MAVKSQGTTFQVTISSTLTDVGEVMSIGEIGQETGLTDVTHLTSTAKEYLGTLPDGKEISINGNYVSNNAGQEFVRDNVGETNAIQINFNSGDSAAFSGVLLSHGVGPFEVDGKIPFSTSVKISGPITWVEA